MQKSSRSTIVVFWALVTVLPIAGIVVSLLDPLQFHAIQSKIQSRAAENFWETAVLFVCTQVLQVVVAPISHYAIGYLGGVAFGLTWGTLLNYLGRVIGHLLAFGLARTFGRPLVQRYVPDAAIAKYDMWVGAAPWALTLVYFLPLFPDDEISYLVGISAMPAQWFLPSLLIGQIGGSLGLACLGAGIRTHPMTFWSVAVVTVLGSVWLWRLSRRRPSRLLKNPAFWSRAGSVG